MIVFYTSTAEHFAQKIDIKRALYHYKQFSDGELYIKVEPEIVNKEIWVMASTQPPAENLLELFFLLDALVRSDVQKINLCITYFAYARQAIAQPGEAATAHLICTLLRQFPLGKIYILHAHAATILQKYLPFDNAIPLDFFCDVAQNYDVIVAPDKGAVDFAQIVALRCKKEIVFFSKRRPAHEQVIIESINGNVKDKKVLLVDDIIASGRTMIQASEALKAIGAREVAAAATHGIFSDNAAMRLQESPIKKVYVTNSLLQYARGNIEVHDISNFIEALLLK